MDGDDQNKNSDGNGPDTGFKPITSQDELNTVLKDRLARERAKFSDYSDLKAKAARLAEIEQANKSEAEKTAERIGALERELESTRSTALRSRIQAKFGISDDDAALFLTAADEATLTKQAERLAESAADRKKSGNRDPFAGRTTNTDAGNDAMREFTRGLFNRD